MTQVLPPLYAKWIGPWLEAPLREESKATCASCAMCAPADAPEKPGTAYYSPVTKCCTYVPELANYLVGRILSDDDADAAEGRASVERRIAGKVGVTPFGLGRSTLYSLVYDNSHAAFGGAAALECPHHLADGRCGVWKHRESTCATWFCKHERGQVGQHFWRRLHDLLAAAERALSRHCVTTLRLPTAALDALVPARAATHRKSSLGADQLDGRVDAAWYERIWGDYAGREAAFYRACRTIVEALDWDDVLALGGAEMALLAELTREAHSRTLRTEPPTRLRQTQLHVLYSSKASARVATYSNIDPLSVPKRLLDVLHRFDGSPTEEVLATIEREDDLRLTPGLVRKLADFGLLTDE